MKKIFLPI
ncbi:hypothetical protein BpHYR1_019455 [Brachionus plicatilis]|uniref:Uncharacterized protein n=1 Tax=Brachionus plicatilis TaxID=10195 RepID=A0A3M7SFD6_BRAPC|nr:hypothetical protein BpHYR1_019455 [Brachionus plicatilis]